MCSLEALTARNLRELEELGEGAHCDNCEVGYRKNLHKIRLHPS